MLDNPPLITLHRGHRRPDRAVIEAFRGAQTSHLVDAMDGRGALDHRIKPMDPANAAFAGPALTALAYPADVVGVYGALWEAEPGDVIVVANDAYAGTAVIGDLVAGMMRNKGVAAFVTDGLARDRAGIVATGLPLFAAGVIPASPARHRRRPARPARGHRGGRRRRRGDRAARAGRGGARTPRPRARGGGARRRRRRHRRHQHRADARHHGRRPHHRPVRGSHSGIPSTAAARIRA
jgi:hypothetical protein